jgi:2'-5' RNA ligase
VRCFVGFFVPEAAKPALLEMQDALRELPIDCKYVEPENLHVCLSFLGELDDAAVADAEAKLEAVCGENTGFRLSAGGIKLIPSDSYVRVIVLDAHDDSGSLEKIAEAVKHGIGGDAKPPHITLCRVRDVRDKQATAQKIKSLHVGRIEFSVGELTLIKSELSRGGPVYSAVRSFKLK